MQDLNVTQTSHRGCQDVMVAYGRVHLCNNYSTLVGYGNLTLAAVTSGLLTIVKTGKAIVSYFGNVTASLFALTIVRKFTPR